MGRWISWYANLLCQQLKVFSLLFIIALALLACKSIKCGVGVYVCVSKCNLIKLKGSQRVSLSSYTHPVHSHTHMCVDIAMRRQLQLKCISCCLPVSCDSNSNSSNNCNTSFCMYLQQHRHLHLPSSISHLRLPSLSAFPFPCYHSLPGTPSYVLRILINR